MLKTSALLYCDRYLSLILCLATSHRRTGRFFKGGLNQFCPKNPGQSDNFSGRKIARLPEKKSCCPTLGGCSPPAPRLIRLCHQVASETALCVRAVTPPRPSVGSSGQIILPRYLMNRLSNLDKTFREYSKHCCIVYQIS